MGTWIEMFDEVVERNGYQRRSLRGNVDRNSSAAQRALIALSRSLRGNVDRNWLMFGCTFQRYHVVPYVGTWIEISSHFVRTKIEYGRSLRGNVDRNCKKIDKSLML